MSDFTFGRCMHGETILLGRSALDQLSGLLKGLPECSKVVTVGTKTSQQNNLFQCYQTGSVFPKSF